MSEEKGDRLKGLGVQDAVAGAAAMGRALSGEVGPEAQVTTPRPWQWEWNGQNNIVVFFNTGGLHSVEVAKLYCDAQNEDERATIEADAELLCRAVNAYSPEDL